MGICYYCEVVDSTDKTSWFEHEMFYVSKRTVIPVGIKYDSKKVIIPRCSDCKRIHNRIYLFTLLIWLILFSASFVLFFYLSNVNLLTNCILSILISSIIAWLANIVYNDFLFEPVFKIKPEGNVDNYPIVKEMLDEGWCESKPDPAGALTAEQNKEIRKQANLK